jgi:hypothetical protein
MAKETRYAERYRLAARSRMVGRGYVLCVCVPILDVFVPGCQGLGGDGKGHGPAHYRPGSRDDYRITCKDGMFRRRSSAVPLGASR